MKHIHRLLSLLLGTLWLATSASAQDVVTYFHPDASGSPTVATDEYGNVLWREEYAPYGERLRQDLSPRTNRLWFTGHHQDDDSGLIYAGARHYDPMTGRLLSADPAGTLSENSFSFNRYAYANNSPYRYTDPNGESALAIGIVGGGLILAGGYAVCDSCREPMRQLAGSAIDSLGETKNWYIQTQLHGLLTIYSMMSGGNRSVSTAADRGGAAATPPEDPDEESAPRKLPQHLRNKLKRIENETAAGGNKGVSGSVTSDEAFALGERFVGPGYRTTTGSNGARILVSRDGVRVFRGPSPKRGVNPVDGQPWSRTGSQVNFEQRAVGRPTSNVHLDVTK